MVRRPEPYDLHTRLRSVERRLRELEGAVQRIGSGVVSGASSLYDAQQLYNPGFEQGFVRWRGSWYWGGGSGAWDDTTVDALSGTSSARGQFAARGDTQMLEHSDAFSVKAGDVYRLQATVRHDWTAENMTIAVQLEFAATEADLTNNWDGSTRVAASAPSIAANTFMRLDGEVIVPSGMKYANFQVYPYALTTTGGGVATAAAQRSVWVDDCSMQRKL